MYECFTDRVKRVMRLANAEAQRLLHEYIGTEHILLGLLKDRRGVAARVLERLSVDVTKVAQAVESIIRMGGGAVASQLPRTPRAKQVVECAIQVRVHASIAGVECPEDGAIEDATDHGCFLQRRFLIRRQSVDRSRRAVWPHISTLPQVPASRRLIWFFPVTASS